MDLRRSKGLFWSIATLTGAISVFFLVKGMANETAAKIIDLAAAIMFSIPAVVSLAMILTNAPIGRIDKAGIYIRSWGVGLVPWNDIESFSISDPGQGGPVIRLHLKNNDQYMSRIGFSRRLGAYFRRAILGTPFVIFVTNIDRHLADVVAEIRRRVPQSARVA